MVLRLCRPFARPGSRLCSRHLSNLFLGAAQAPVGILVGVNDRELVLQVVPREPLLRREANRVSAQVKGLDGGQQGLLALMKAMPQVGSPALHKLSAPLGTKMPGINGRGGTRVRVTAGLNPTSTNRLHEAGLGQPESLKPESLGYRGALVGRGKKKGDVVGANSSDSSKGGEGAAEVPFRGN